MGNIASSCRDCKGTVAMSTQKRAADGDNQRREEARATVSGRTLRRSQVKENREEEDDLAKLENALCGFQLNGSHHGRLPPLLTSASRRRQWNPSLETISEDN
ncbi:hypothetical protein MLD38_028160 [Melastoma candidum]|uniref:Uncharacterized protein n=1 Tax=Melastoma candidum TaxID=119954 RepID=A0ACB9N1R8_9MYRT|nr:hypothetical protein MLD38_028160 [Melastoma candidum]